MNEQGGREIGLHLKAQDAGPGPVYYRYGIFAADPETGKLIINMSSDTEWSLPADVTHDEIVRVLTALFDDWYEEQLREARQRIEYDAACRTPENLRLIAAAEDRAGRAVGMLYATTAPEGQG